PPRLRLTDARLRLLPGKGGAKVMGKQLSMTPAEVADISRDAITTMVLVSAPLMLVALIVGVAIGLLQALTQIQEITLVFVPKIVAIFLTLLLVMPLMGSLMGGFMTRIAEKMVQ